MPQLLDRNREAVAKKKQPPPQEPTQSSTRIARELLRKANILARMQGVSLYDLVDGLLRPQIERDFKGLFQSEEK